MKQNKSEKKSTKTSNCANALVIGSAITFTGGCMFYGIYTASSSEYFDISTFAGECVAKLINLGMDALQL